MPERGYQKINAVSQGQEENNMGKSGIAKEIGKVLNIGLNEPFDIFDYNNEPTIIKIKKKTRYQKWFIIFDGTHFYLTDKDNIILAKSKTIKKLIPEGVANKL